MSNKVIRKVKLCNLFALVILSLLLLSACGQPAMEPKKTDTSQVKTSSQENASKESASTASPKKDQWNDWLQGAKAEGKVVVSGAPSELWRKALIEPFQKLYPEIKVEYTGLNGRDFWPKVLQEQKVGQYLWDLRIGGPDSIGWDKAREIVEPIRPLLLPEIADDSKWLGGLDGLFIDKDMNTVPAFLAYANMAVRVNRDLVPESELSTVEQLLDPKFKGKIVINDPRGGAGLGSLTILLAHYGEEFIKTLLTKQDLIVSRDNRQIVEWVVRGRYPIVIGDDSTNLINFQKQGLGLNVHELDNGPIKLSTGFGIIEFLKKAPHSNAAKVYLNWLLSKEGQTEITQILALNSKRLDVSLGDKETAVDPKHLDRYIAHQSEKYDKIRDRAQELGTQLIK